MAVIDAESGRLLRLTVYKGGKPVVRTELRDVAAGEFDSGDFEFTPPAGLRVDEAAGREPPRFADAARDFLGSLRGKI